MDGIRPETATLSRVIRHVWLVRAGLRRITRLLEERGDLHDESKLSNAEFPGFARMSSAAARHPYGSPEYRASLDAERPTIERHQGRNRHHPEHYLDPAREMGLLDLIEMVADWRAAWEVYDETNGRTWEDSLAVNRERRAATFSREQWWVIEEVARLLSRPEAARG